MRTNNFSSKPTKGLHARAQNIDRAIDKNDRHIENDKVKFSFDNCSEDLRTRVLTFKFKNDGAGHPEERHNVRQ